MRKLTFILASVVMITGCTTNSKESGYIPRSDIRIEDGVMTPETLLSFGRVSGGKLSPDSKTILYGVTYTSIEQNRSCRNLFVVDSDGSNCRQISRYGKSVSSETWSKDGKSIYFLQ